MNATTGMFVSRETFSYDAAGNITGGSDDSTNKLIKPYNLSSPDKFRR